jgi:hypothetical protein
MEISHVLVKKEGFLNRKTKFSSELTFYIKGNEPWDYNADFYVKILEGMAAGFKAGDPNIWVSPGAFQADTKDIPPNGDGISWNDKYAGLCFVCACCVCL